MPSVKNLRVKLSRARGGGPAVRLVDEGFLVIVGLFNPQVSAIQVRIKDGLYMGIQQSA